MTHAASAQSRPFTVSSSDASAHGLSSIGFSVDLAGTGLIATPFPSAREYAIFSGPPGGPLLVRIEPSGGRITAEALDALVTEHGARWGSPLTLGARETVTLDEDTRPAITASTGTSLASTQWCVVLVPAHTMRRPMGLLVAFGVENATRLTCAQILANRSLGAFARSFRVH